MKTIALFSVKGGVGKTATAVNLAYMAARSGEPTLLIDLDPQNSAGFYLRMKSRPRSHSRDLLEGKKRVQAMIRESDYEGLDVVPAKRGFRNLDRRLDGEKDKRHRLQSIMRYFRNDYSRIIIDSPPHFGLLSENIFHAADTILVPVIPTTLSLRTLKQLLDFFNERKLNVKKIVPFYSMVDRRKKIHRETLEGRAETDLIGVKPRFLQSMIPNSSVVERMGVRQEPVPLYAPRSTAGKALENLFQELVSLELL